MITWNCAINLTSQCFVCKGIKNNWGWGYHSDPILICCGIAVLILRFMYKYQKLTTESLGSRAHIFFLNDAWKTQGNMNQCNHWNTRWWQDWGVVSLQGRGQFTLIVIWRFNETKSDPQLSQTTGAMTTELSRWRLAWWWFFHLSHT